MRVIAALVALNLSGCSESSCESIERCAAPADGSHSDGSHADASVPDLGACESHDDCLSDSYCADDLKCVPYGTPVERDHDEECELSPDIGVFEPSVQCAWTTPPEGDGYPSSNQVTTTPLIVDFDFDRDLATLRPSIVFVSHAPASGVASADSVLRVIDGASCGLQHNVAAWADPNNTPAVGDLDGDARADIVAVVNTHVTAFSYVAAAEAFAPMWTATERVFGGSIALHDMDDDGRAEVIADRYVYDAEGRLIATLGTRAMNEIPVIADVDEDGEMEIVTPEGIFRYDTTTGLEPEAYFAGTVSPIGHSFVAVGDLGMFPLATFGGDRAEIVVAGLGEIRVETLEGTRVFTATFSDGSSSAAGGPPTIADFDGDGRAEIGVAALEEYVVFDLDCREDGDPAYCLTARMDRRLWSIRVRDLSSGITGSTVFDFDADGAVEVVYADECFLRVFRGTDGAVLFSHPRSSGTNTEMAVVADADGDFRSEIVVAGESWEMCPERDPYRPAVTFRQTSGVYVLGDPLDRWAPSRPIWNQHAYAVTHVGDRGELPRSRDVRINWRTSGLNNFRQNTQSVPDPLAAPDLTSGRLSGAPLVCRGAMAVAHARICNRGRLPVGRGVEVAFREGAVDGLEFCRATTESLIDVGRCIEIGCSGMAPEQNVDLYVVPDPEGSFRECHEQNNTSVLENVGCVRLE